MHHLEITYQGRVQGVGFRATVADLARRFEVLGMVQNRIDGSVRLVVEGDEQELVLFAEAIRERLARNIVSESDNWKAIATSSYAGFSIGPTE